MNEWRMWIGRMAGVEGIGRGDRPVGRGAGWLPGVLGLALALTACAPRAPEGVPLQRSAVSLDLPLDPSIPGRMPAAHPVQTEPPPLGSGYTPPQAAPQRLGGMPAKDMGIPARGPDTVGQPSAYAAPYKPVVRKKTTVQKKAAVKKKSAVKKKKPTARQAKPAVTCPCDPPRVQKKPVIQ
ncbi:MAG: hypothetical protein H7838_05840 [Magnetococcus sp. DMHC-8]